MFPKNAQIQSLIRSALREDATHADLTSQCLIASSWKVDAAFVAKQAGVVAGLPFASQVFRTQDPNTHFKALVRDGDSVRPGQRLALIKGRARSILAAERTALNGVQHLSGIATYARAQVKRLGPGRTRLLDTRKTLPGWRLLQKYAVRCGGAVNHRMSLAGAILIKENHLKIARLAKSDWQARLRRVLDGKKQGLIEMEIQTPQDFRDALRLKPSLVLLDNLPPSRMRPMIQRLRREIPGVTLEISGGVTPAQLPTLGKLGVERISMGALTHSVKAFDCSLDILHVYA